MANSSAPGRRDFLRRSIALVPASAALGAAGAAGVAGTADAAAAQAANPPAAAPYTPAYFNADEWAFVKAAVGRLIPSDAEGPGAIEAGVPEFIDRQMDTAWGNGGLWYMQGPFAPDASPLFGYQNPMPPRELYRASIAALDAACRQQRGGKTFAQLDAAAQDEVLHALDQRKLQLDGVPAKDFFDMLLQNAKEGYFSDPIHGGNKNAAAWAMIGFPGARADYLDWVNRPGERYPLPPVSIAGPQG
ncbi:gluconate 2-dehydrogenase subunit 3 family protein [Variovorax sp.]|uniref:gluconate 2-dehydrogenase subunit 3 family protein n=1 Tax=Variovorax sp. TaxID=1871043 RepID=UPI002D37B409|nr:gluconate 2-dehydrogenase subunit 3 family protein [Variovorax sp.]HYP86426.1 gluconate 2-dehydrogenase subunit 3 family protein [Variovorax sp.]